jgi:hypothetical protein
MKDGKIIKNFKNFDHAIAAVPLNGKLMFLDVTAENC